MHDSFVVQKTLCSDLCVNDGNALFCFTGLKELSQVELDTRVKVAAKLKESRSFKANDALKNTAFRFDSSIITEQCKVQSIELGKRMRVKVSNLPKEAVQAAAGGVAFVSLLEHKGICLEFSDPKSSWPEIALILGLLAVTYDVYRLFKRKDARIKREQENRDRAARV